MSVGATTGENELFSQLTLTVMRNKKNITFAVADVNFIFFHYPNKGCPMVCVRPACFLRGARWWVGRGEVDLMG